MKKNILKSVVTVGLAVSIYSLLLSSCAKKVPTLNASVPTPSFTYTMLTPTSDSTAQNLELINTSKDAMAAYWTIPGVGNFKGDTIKLIIQHAGTYTVKLAAGGPGGLSDTTSQDITIDKDNPYTVKAAFNYQILTPTSFENSQNLELISTSQYELSASWSVSDSDGNSMGTYEGETVKVTIPSAGKYWVKLTAAGYGGLTDTSTQMVTITQDNPYGNDPNSIFGILNGLGLGLTQRTWIPERVVNSVIVWDNYADCLNQINGGGGAWWAFGAGEIATNGTGRDGYLDDQYTITVGKPGQLIYNDNKTVYLDKGGSGWTGALSSGWNDSLGTYSSTDLYNLFPALKPWASGTFTYSITTAPTGAMHLGTITVNGVGAHIGLQDKTNSGDETTPTASSVTYDVLRISPGLTDASTGATYDEIILGVQESGLVWTFMFRSNR